jgi:hypothetical protein
VEACCWGTLWGNDINTFFPEKTPRFGAHCQNEVPIELRRAEISVKKIFSSIANNKKDPQKKIVPLSCHARKLSTLADFLRNSYNFPIFDILSRY